MIPETRHFAVTVASVIGALSLALVFHTPSGMSAFPTIENQMASVSDSIEESQGAVVVTNTSREDMRALLVRELRENPPTGEEHPREKAEEEAREVTTTQPAPPLTNEKDGRALLCENASPLMASTPWGPLTVTIAEGARVIAGGGKTLQLPLDPVPQSEPACLPPGPVALALDGTPLMSGAPVTSEYEGIVGYALDGFSLYSPYEDGRILTSKDLDACHGHIHAIMREGELVMMYHYHVTADAPYTLGCFRGVPVGM